MTKKLLFVFLILFAGSAGLFAAELSGTYDKDYTVEMRLFMEALL